MRLIKIHEIKLMVKQSWDYPRYIVHRVLQGLGSEIIVEICSFELIIEFYAGID
jgi:hypothetical protein